MPVTVFAFAVAFADGHSQADRDSRLARARPGRRVRSLKAREAGSCVVEIKMFLIIDVSSRNFLVVNDLQGVKVTPIHCKIERTRFPHQRLVPAERWRSELVSAEPQQPHSTKISSRDVLLVSRCEFSAVCCQPNHRNIITQRDGAGLFEGFWSEIALETGSKSKHIKVMAPTEQKINEKKACHPYSINPAPRWCIKSV